MKPSDLLPNHVDSTVKDGVTIRKGSVSAFIANVETILSPAAREEEVRVARQDMLDLVPALEALGLFKVFEVKDQRIKAILQKR